MCICYLTRSVICFFFSVVCNLCCEWRTKERRNEERKKEVELRHSVTLLLTAYSVSRYLSILLIPSPSCLLNLYVTTSFLPQKNTKKIPQMLFYNRFDFSYHKVCVNYCYHRMAGRVIQADTPRLTCILLGCCAVVSRWACGCLCNFPRQLQQRPIRQPQSCVDSYHVSL